MAPKITLYTQTTPNGYPISILLEELGVEYEAKGLSFAKQEQKSEDFLKINPNGRIPAIVDHGNGDQRVFETIAILLYLTELYDPEGKLSFKREKDLNLWTEQLSWLSWAQGGLGPMQGQANHFVRYAPEKIEYGMRRYTDETKRLFGIVEKQLEGNEFLVGNRYSIVDIKAFPWIAIAEWSGVKLDDYPNIRAWLDRCQKRPATHKGLGVPERVDVQDRLAKAEEHGKDIAKQFGFTK